MRPTTTISVPSDLGADLRDLATHWGITTTAALKRLVEAARRQEGLEVSTPIRAELRDAAVLIFIGDRHWEASPAAAKWFAEGLIRISTRGGAYADGAALGLSIRRRGTGICVQDTSGEFRTSMTCSEALAGGKALLELAAKAEIIPAKSIGMLSA